MFANNELLRKRTPHQGIGRKDYIQNLVNEFHGTTNVEAQEQISANLANFAYDPINFDFLRESSAVDLFLQLLALPNDRLVLNGIAGVNNICLDPLSRVKITSAENITLVFEVLQSSENFEIAINILTLFHFLLSEDPTIKQLICSSKNLQRIHDFKKSSDKRLKIVAELFVEDFGVRTENVRQ